MRPTVLKNILPMACAVIFLLSCNTSSKRIYEHKNARLQFQTDGSEGLHYIIDGHLRITIDKNWVEIRKFGELERDNQGKVLPNEWIIPRERLVYYGKRIPK